MESSYKNETVIFENTEPNIKMSTDEALRIFHKHLGSIKNEIDFEIEKDDYLNKKCEQPTNLKVRGFKSQFTRLSNSK